MRYQHWDVLLFPGDSKIPIQEFDTKCYALQQASSLQGLEFNGNNYESMVVLPTLTCFVASLERGSSFRVSIHSWEKPKASSLLLSFKTAEEMVLFEAKIYVDGILTAYDGRPLIYAPDLTLLPATGPSKTMPGQK